MSNTANCPPPHQGESSQTIRERVISARRIQAARFSGKGATTNAAMGPRQMKAHCQIDSTGSSYLEQAMEQMNFSARAHDRILKVARTLARLQLLAGFEDPDR